MRQADGVTKVLIVKPPTKEGDKLLEILKTELQKVSSTIVIDVWDNAKKIITNEDIKKAEADLFISFNLAGFDHSTLTGGVAYNLLDCKQIHILLEKRLPNELLLSKQLSISMFFYCAGSDYYNYLMEKYPDMPYLKQLETWRLGMTEEDINTNAQTLCKVTEEIMQICHLS